MYCDNSCPTKMTENFHNLNFLFMHRYELAYGMLTRLDSVR